jgi:hypothetical protein
MLTSMSTCASEVEDAPGRGLAVNFRRNTFASVVTAVGRRRPHRAKIGG